MIITNWFSFWGLILDVIGAVFIYVYGIPSDYWILPKQKEEQLKNINNELSTEFKNHQKKIKERSLIGIMLIIFGFILQLLANVNFCQLYN